eukprot:TRINITY_DN451_c0_g1_i1.p1 TRINITY_DN451_c0_g1~~TRINITY_DN451_c0_g1_i1.p1  ORF type:complete len:237 (-),score=37.16 TRINITY_DN451_c0_g1_i1:181-891(-)
MFYFATMLIISNLLGSAMQYMELLQQLPPGAVQQFLVDNDISMEQAQQLMNTEEGQQVAQKVAQGDMSFEEIQGAVQNIVQQSNQEQLPPNIYIEGESFKENQQKTTTFYTQLDDTNSVQELQQFTQNNFMEGLQKSLMPFLEELAEKFLEEGALYMEPMVEHLDLVDLEVVPEIEPIYEGTDDIDTSDVMEAPVMDDQQKQQPVIEEDQNNGVQLEEISQQYFFLLILIVCCVVV